MYCFPRKHECFKHNNESTALQKVLDFAELNSWTLLIMVYRGMCAVLNQAFQRQMYENYWQFKCGLKFQFHFPTLFYCLQTLHICEVFPQEFQLKSVAFAVTNITNLWADKFWKAHRDLTTTSVQTSCAWLCVGEKTFSIISQTLPGNLDILRCVYSTLEAIFWFSDRVSHN